jgi:hypothetical protein
MGGFQSFFSMPAKRDSVGQRHMLQLAAERDRDTLEAERQISGSRCWRKCPKMSNMISREPIWREVRSEKTLDSQGFYGVS